MSKEEEMSHFLLLFLIFAQFVAMHSFELCNAVALVLIFVVCLDFNHC